MISPELIRRYPFFADISMAQIVTLAHAAEETSIKAEQYIFHEGQNLDHFFLVLEGKVDILITQPNPATGQSTERQTVVSVIEPGGVLGWSALVPPHAATSSSKAFTDSRLISFDCTTLHQAFKKDCQFGYLMMQKMAHVIRGRLQDMRIESLSLITPTAG
jgi:CRP-like cAMP-binding protein